MPPKLFTYLIVVWTIVCFSGLGIFLFELYGPGSDLNAPAAYPQSPLITAGFWLMMWLLPTIVMVIAARRQENDGK